MTRNVLAGDLMSRPVRQLTASTPIADAAAFLLRHGISGAPVLDDHGRWIGVFTQNDLARAVEKRLVRSDPGRSLEHRESPPDILALPPAELSRTPVRSFMTRGLFTVFPGATLDEVIRSMTSNGVHRIFVIDERDGSLLGVITTMDVMRWMDQRNRRSSEARTILPA